MSAAVVALKTLGVIRLANGMLALLAPGRLITSFGADPAENGAAVYALRLFGVRTIVLGVELLVADERSAGDALRYAVPIHASDTASAAIAGLTGAIPRRAAVTGTAISSLNTLLAVVASRGARG